MPRIFSPQPYPAGMVPDESDTSLVGSWCCPRAKSALQDYSSAGNDLSINGGVVLGRNNSFVGNGTDAYLRKAVANYRSADTTTGTIEIWFKRPAYDAPTSTLFCTTDEGSDTDRFAVYIASNTLWLRCCSSGTTVPDGFTGTDNQHSTADTLSYTQFMWYHGVIVATGATYVFYINGASVGISSHSGSLFNSQWIGRVLNRDSIVIGADTSNAGTTYYCNDEIGGVNLYSEAKSAAWVATRFKACVPDSTLRLWIPYGDVDYSRYRHTLTKYGSPILGTRMTFDGTDDRIACGDLRFNIAEVSFWCKPATTTEQFFRVDTGKSVATAAGTITYTGLTPTATYVNAVATTTLAAGYWQNVVCQFEATDANNFDLCYDGTNFGAMDLCDVKVRTTARGVGLIVDDYMKSRGDY